MTYRALVRLRNDLTAQINGLAAETGALRSHLASVSGDVTKMTEASQWVHSVDIQAEEKGLQVAWTVSPQPKGQTVYLLYRPSGSVDWLKAPLLATGPEWRALIPTPAITASVHLVRTQAAAGTQQTTSAAARGVTDSQPQEYEWLIVGETATERNTYGPQTLLVKPTVEVQVEFRQSDGKWLVTAGFATDSFPIPKCEVVVQAYGSSGGPALAEFVMSDAAGNPAAFSHEWQPPQGTKSVKALLRVDGQVLAESTMGW